MHELSIAMSMIEMAHEEIDRRGGGRVTALHLKLGPLSGVVKEALEFSYEIACQGTALDGSQLIVEDVPVMIHCSNCRQEQIVESIQSLRCPDCGLPSNDVRQGRDLEVVALELEEDPLLADEALRKSA
ncbi:MAG TPA: hydrogenase maturation nickel metallochaperone HypA [Pyrinomonadaceae bacterium]|nr:hydrogenase maturation nickel metallochaperone HypA [Pyrinomonadaceae bacterium]